MKAISIDNNTIRISKIDIVKEVQFNSSTILDTTTQWVELSIYASGLKFTERRVIEEDDWFNYQCEDYKSLNKKHNTITAAMERV